MNLTTRLDVLHPSMESWVSDHQVTQKLKQDGRVRKIKFKFSDLHGDVQKLQFRNSMVNRIRLSQHFTMAVPGQNAWWYTLYYSVLTSWWSLINERCMYSSKMKRLVLELIVKGVQIQNRKPTFLKMYENNKSYRKKKNIVVISKSLVRGWRKNQISIFCGECSVYAWMAMSHMWHQHIDHLNRCGGKEDKTHDKSHR